jgi:hypothetical protein
MRLVTSKSGFKARGGATGEIASGWIRDAVEIGLEMLSRQRPDKLSP